MAALLVEDVLGTSLVQFSRYGMFPGEEEVSAMSVDSKLLPTALNTLTAAKAELEDEIRAVSRESAPVVDSWIRHAKALQEDIEKSKALANDIARQAEAGDAVKHAVKDAEARVEFLTKEACYNSQVAEALQGIAKVKNLLDQAEEAGIERQILKALHLLSEAWDVKSKIPAYEKTRALKLLDDRAFALKALLQEDFSDIWKALVNVDADAGSVIIQKDIDDAMTLDDAVVVMKAYKDLQDRVNKFNFEFYTAIIRPRVDLKVGELSSILIDDNSISTASTHADRTIKSLFADLERIIVFLSELLPAEFARPLSQVMMPKLCAQIKNTWLDSAVPTSLDDMTAFRKALALVQVFAERLGSLQWAGAGELHEWVENAPRIWLTKRRETALDWIRNQLALGIGVPKKVERVETQTISRTEGLHITPNANANGASNDWDAAWSDEEEERASANRARRPSVQEALKDDPGNWTTEALKDGEPRNENQGDEVVEAWGWGDDDPIDEEQVERTLLEAKRPIRDRVPKAERVVTLTELYTISSMPGHVLQTITTIIEDGAVLTQQINEQNPVTTAAVGLFGLPALVLAMYRAVSPPFYRTDVCGNMYLYNDAMWLAEQLRNFSKDWAEREDLNLRAQGKVKFEIEALILEKFARRSYSHEMNLQRTVLSDMLGGSQNFLHNETQGASEDEAAIASVVTRIREMAQKWQSILSKSAWAQATGSLCNTVAKKMISDVMDMHSLGADEAYRVANMISEIIKLDDLFLLEQGTAGQAPIPFTSQYVPDWLRLNYLCEVLQSDLKDVKYLWFESELSLYFTAQEVVELIELSFENNHRTRDAIGQIRTNPKPRGVLAGEL